MRGRRAWPDYDEVIATMVDGAYDTSGWVDHIELDQMLTRFQELRAGRRMKILVDL
jgi:(R,R)-butanediol dehydrogenase / meso-butanediol dehydrogenase / diacetyl reductase